MPKQGANPNLNRGGNDGNLYGGGRKSNATRRKYLVIADVGADYLLGVAKGNKVIEEDAVLLDGKVKTIKRRPTHGERVEAIKEGPKHGLPQKVEITLGSDDFFRAVVDAMREENHPKEAIKAVIDRLRETFKDHA